MGRNYNYLLDNIINYNYTFQEKHTINLTGVYGFQYNQGRDFILDIQDNTKNYLGIWDIENTNPTTAKTYAPQYNPNISGKAYYVGRINYSYDNRYNLTLSRRWDYTSQFGPNKKLGKFNSVAGAWNISREEFLKSNPYLNILKYRISWGEVGNDRIPQFSYLYSAASASYIVDGNVVSGWTSGESGNYSLQWETSRQFNTGIDFSMFKNRISGSIDYYSSRNFDILYAEQVPIVFGDQNGLITSNVAETKGWGLGALLTGKIIDGEFKWQVTLNWSKDANKIVNLGGKKVDENGNPIDDIANGWFIGQDMDVIYDYKFIGIYQTADTATARRMHPDKKYYGAGDPMIADIDGNDTINEDDKTFQGSSVTPNWYGGITNTFKYKGFEFSFLIETVQGINRVNYFIGSYNGRGNTIKENYWTPRNPSNEFPQPSSVGNYDYPNAVRLQDASFIALRNISFAYNLPLSLIKKTPVKAATVYVRGNNLKYFTKFQGYSPESEAGAFPISKVWTAGINVTF
jgi:TonB-linked SusC/RagA family outer membrane protein